MIDAKFFLFMCGQAGSEKCMKKTATGKEIDTAWS